MMLLRVLIGKTHQSNLLSSIIDLTPLGDLALDAHAI
jgi:hypothetical protein